jgi:uncharacterized protein YndB with AHSA1/START domain
MGGLNRLEQAPRQITQSIRVSGTAHRAWQAWAEPDHIVRWFCDRASGGCLPGDEAVWEFNGFEHPARYRVERSWPGRILVYTAGEPPSARSLEINFEASGDGAQVTVIDQSLPQAPEFDELATGVASGWANALRYLDLYLSHYHGRTKRTDIALTAGQFDCEAALHWFEPGLKRERWLDVPAGELQPGWRLPRHFVWLWPAIEGTLELNSFHSASGQPAIALRAVSWAVNPPAGFDARIRDSVERLSRLLVS